jgi:hypothetical protein
VDWPGCCRRSRTGATMPRVRLGKHALVEVGGVSWGSCCLVRFGERSPPLTVTVSFSTHSAELSKQTGHHLSTGAQKPRCKMSICGAGHPRPLPLLPILTVGAAFRSGQHSFTRVFKSELEISVSEPFRDLQKPSSLPVIRRFCQKKMSPKRGARL